jgi:hypothetical protein
VNDAFVIRADRVETYGAPSGAAVSGSLASRGELPAL